MQLHHFEFEINNQKIICIMMTVNAYIIVLSNLPSVKNMPKQPIMILGSVEYLIFILKRNICYLYKSMIHFFGSQIDFVDVCRIFP